MLVSIKSGSLGLNLHMAQNVIFTDFWWNPQVEMQAIDRVHRFGQKKEVHVYRIVAEKTVDEVILRLQKKKKRLFSTAMRGMEDDDEAEGEEEEEGEGEGEGEGDGIFEFGRGGKLTIPELRLLFGI